MISSRRLLQMLKRWMKTARLSRKRISFHNNSDRTCSGGTPSAPPTAKGHFVAYTNDGKRHVLPLTWLVNDIFSELLKMAEEEFGLPGDGPITFPFKASFMEELSISMQRNAPKDLREALLLSVAGHRCSDPISHASAWINSQPQPIAF